MPNLLPYQHRLLIWLKHHESWIIANTDKNLGRCVIELAQYIQNALSHLDNPDLYETLTEAEDEAEALRIEREINAWAVLAKIRNAIDADEYKYILSNTAKNAKDPHGYFYLLYKVHKKRKIPNKTPSRPV